MNNKLHSIICITTYIITIHHALRIACGEEQMMVFTCLIIRKQNINSNINGEYEIDVKKTHCMVDIKASFLQPRKN